MSVRTQAMKDRNYAELKERNLRKRRKESKVKRMKPIRTRHRPVTLLVTQEMADQLERLRADHGITKTHVITEGAKLWIANFQAKCAA